MHGNMFDMEEKVGILLCFLNPECEFNQVVSAELWHLKPFYTLL